ncbi:MAG: hypothetical protein AVDCRST_MAG08-2943 [uncultured Acetobacteraceae bacterium]|uniref:Uncharacterized protein n=1 Tax=uncultured Acetobacteraceae bacterium TaxID=169975 RepID=A0A6J4J1B7_9PROT|nr:MAG: hypothetical protein AVDCRST_MAG08-2943 [uncultured Acetobacteraceae bacterium]
MTHFGGAPRREASAHTKIASARLWPFRARLGASAAARV